MHPFNKRGLLRRQQKTHTHAHRPNNKEKTTNEYTHSMHKHGAQKKGSDREGAITTKIKRKHSFKLPAHLVFSNMLRDLPVRLPQRMTSTGANTNSDEHNELF